jgi:uncharacterized protein YprB with RNaseH-like and TPR domain
MDLRKRLARLDRLTRRPEENRTLQGDAAERPRATRETLDRLGLTHRDTERGPLWTVESVDPVAVPLAPVSDMTEVFSQGHLARPQPGDILFLDTETTGLAGGTGTIAFLVGVSWWAQGELVTRQYFLPDPGHEPAMLADLAVLAAGFEVLVTFNGASFDLPLLRTRARLNRMDDPVADLIGWDLLVPARRLWGHRLENCRQQTLENEICGMTRQAGDIDGSRIPQSWFDFLASGEPGLLPNVLTHNRRDMVGMALVFDEVVRVCSLIEGAAEAGGFDPRGLPWDLAWALGRVCERRRDTGASLALLEWAVGAASSPNLTNRRFLADAVRILKRGGDWTLVEGLLDRGLGLFPDESWLHREAAILYEHRKIDLARALDHAAKSGEDHRLERLRKLLGAADPVPDQTEQSK